MPASVAAVTPRTSSGAPVAGRVRRSSVEKSHCFLECFFWEKKKVERSRLIFFASHLLANRKRKELETFKPHVWRELQQPELFPAASDRRRRLRRSWEPGEGRTGLEAVVDVGGGSVGSGRRLSESEGRSESERASGRCASRRSPTIDAQRGGGGVSGVLVHFVGISRSISIAAHHHAS